MSILKEFGTKVWGFDLAGEVFIETGTGYGESLRNALASAKFSELHSIEVSKERLQKTWKTILHSKVHLYHGSSPDLLPRIIDPDKKTVFWLDAHYEGPEFTEPRHGQCPLLHELKIIVETEWKIKPIILIDDYAAFMSENLWWKKYGQHLDPEQWPTWEQIYDLMGGVDYKWNFFASKDGILYCW